jgi:predicted MFS family arabinose efflux permease
VQFWFPTWMIFLLDRGFTPFQAAVADALFNAMVLLSEIPMGRVVDRIGRKPALLLSCGGTAVVFVGIGVVDSFWVLLLVWGLWGILWALASGLDTTYAWELAETQRSPISPNRYLGRTRIATGLAGMVSLLSAGLLLEIWSPLPYFLTAALGLVALLIASRIPGIPQRTAEASTGGETPTGERRSLRSAVGRPEVRTGIALGALVLTAGISIRILFQPLGLGLGLGAVEISLCYGVIAAAVAVGGWLGSRLPVVSRGPWIVTSLALMALSYAIVAWTAHLGLAWLTMLIVVPLGTAAFGVGKTITDLWLVGAVGREWRATALSLASAGSGLAMVLARPSIVALGGASTNGTAFLGWALITVLCCAVALWLIRRRV